MAASGFLRLISVGLRRYSREPETRRQSARIMVGGAISLLAAETTPGEAALIIAEYVAGLSEIARLEARKGERA